MLPILLRYAPRETIIAKGTRRARLVPAGAKVFAPPIAAMFDPEEFRKPWTFVDKEDDKKKAPRHSYNYMHFGPEGVPDETRKDGPRICFGRYVADVLIVEIVRALLLCEELKRAAGPSGRVAYNGPVPRSLILTFKP